MCGRSSASRACEKITQPPAPFQAIARGFAGPSLLAMILVDKYADHQPLNRQSEQFAREGIELSVSTMADHVGACAATLRPLYEMIKAHVFAAERIHGDDTTVPVLAKLKTRIGRIWTYVRDDRPFGGEASPDAGRTRDANCSSLPISPRTHATKGGRRSRRSLSRRFRSLMPFSCWSVRLTACRPKRGWPRAAKTSLHW